MWNSHPEPWTKPPHFQPRFEYAVRSPQGTEVIPKPLEIPDTIVEDTEGEIKAESLVSDRSS